MDEIGLLRLVLYIIIGGAALMVAVVTAALSANKFVHRLVEEKMTKHHKKEHILEGDTTVRDRLVECRRQCPVINPNPAPAAGGEDHDTRGQYKQIRRR